MHVIQKPIMHSKGLDECKHSESKCNSEIDLAPITLMFCWANVEKTGCVH